LTPEENFGMQFDSLDVDVKEGDIIESYILEEIPR